MRTFDLQTDMRFSQKLRHINWGLVVLITLVACIGFTALYSAAGGNWDPWAKRQMVRFGIGLCVMIVIATIDIRFWQRVSYLAYIVGFIMLVIVETMGRIGKGAQRWIDLGFIQIQPSETIKIFLVMALARYFHAATENDVRRLTFLIIPAVMTLIPMGLVLVQPDLEMAGMIGLAGASIFFLGGAPMWIFILAIVAVLIAAPTAWFFFLKDYQKDRITIFLNPESDPLGAGYHITQSKIALGSGGLSGKGFLEGSQSHLNFLPEKQTDFIFTLWAEEWGLFGGVVLLVLLGLILLYCGWIALRCRHDYGRLLAFGLMINFSLYIFINVAMVMGLIPVMGTPLPLVSYGGTAMLTVMAGFGLIMSCHIHRDAKLPRM